MRLVHKQVEPEPAFASLEVKSDAELQEKPVFIYILDYKAINRVLKIIFEPEEQNKIIGWEETYSEFSNSPLTSKASIRKTIRLDYWNKHNAADSTYIIVLGLDN